ncbi:MAG: polyamine aminopropyltransferase [Myxococcota bacterium]|nr:polyamine aminopropyltransferase [Myxococcota bacterium]
MDLTAQRRRFKHAGTVLGISTILMGACGIVYEYTLGALGNNLMGSSHEQIFVIIGLMLFAMGIGSALQKKITKDLIDRFLLLEIALGFAGGASVLVIYVTFVYTTFYAVTMYAFACLIGVLIGLEIPLLIRINSTYASSLRASLSNILCMDYLGALAGALVFTYFLLSRLSIERIALVLGIINTLIGMGGLFYFWPLVRRQGILLTAGIAISLGLALSAGASEGWMATLEQRCFRDPIILSETTTYQHLVMTKRGDRTHLYINGHLQFSSEDEHIYHELLVHPPMAVANSRKQVLVLGGGDGLAAREILRYGDVADITIVDLDARITELAATHPDLIRLNQGALIGSRVSIDAAQGLSPGPLSEVKRATKAPHELHGKTAYAIAQVHVVNIDADLFIRGLHGPYDVVIIDFPDPSTVELAKLYSVEFYKALKRSMSPRAVMSIQSTSPFHAKQVYLCIGKTLEQAGFKTLPYHQNVPSFGEWGWHLAWTHDELPSEMKKRIRGIERLTVPTRYLTAELLASAFIFGRGWLRSEGIAWNTKMRPIILDYFKTAWEKG